MIIATAIGLLCAVIASIPDVLQGRVSIGEPVLVGVAAMLAVLVHRLMDVRLGRKGRVYDGLADFLIHIYSRYADEKPVRWLWRGLISFILTLSGNFAGIEGAASEASQSLALSVRPRADRWNEQRRRTDIAAILAGGISAVFQAPFAGVVLCLELGIGGRALSAVMSSISAYVGVLFISKRFDLDTAWISYFNAAPPGEILWWILPVLGAGLGVFAAGFIRFVQFYQEILMDWVKAVSWLRPLLGAFLLILISRIFPISQDQPAVEYMNLMASPGTAPQILSFMLSEGVILATVLACFGTLGIFSPLFSLGGGAGQLVLHGSAGLLSGAAGMWAGVLGAPLAGAVLVFELTRSWRLLAASLITGLVADYVRKILSTDTLIRRNLSARGLKLVDGRNVKILETILVRDAMVTDHQVVHENDLVKDLMGTFVASRHPFLPVVRRDGRYAGLLTLDLVQEGLDRVSRSKADFYEVKDLLYRSNIRSRTIDVGETLASASVLFGKNPCVAVTDGDEVVGLLFAHSVRAAYDREVARRALVESAEEGPL